MGHRAITLRGERAVVDIVGPTAQAIRTPWGIIRANPGDVVVPYGDTAVLVPERLLEALQQPVEVDPGELDEFTYRPEADDGEAATDPSPDFENMGIHELRAYASTNYRRQKPWFTMRKDEILADLRSR